MKTSGLTLIAIALGLAACATRTDTQVATTAEPETPVEETPVETERAPGSLDIVVAPNAGFEVEGEAGVRELDDQRSSVTIEIRGAASNAMLPWHVHEGVCGSGGAIVGDASAYPPLAAGLDGTASAEAVIDVSLDPAADYHINVHESPSEMDTVVACGDLNQG
ncbi:MAG TPA: hypothetical protein VJP59_11890 [Gemmatimonadota bacterium]|nr:hypothetical protein [Gemmatimonadota bacterium]